MAQKKTKILFIKYHEAADQQPLSKKAAEKLGIFPSLALLQLAGWVRQHGFPVELIDLGGGGRGVWIHGDTLLVSGHSHQKWL